MGTFGLMTGKGLLKVAARVGAKADELQAKDASLSRIESVQQAIIIVKEEDKKCP